MLLVAREGPERAVPIVGASEPDGVVGHLRSVVARVHVQVVQTVVDEEPVGLLERHECLGVVEGDVHDVGKNIVAILLKGAGYEVSDLGTDVPTKKIIEFVKKENPDYLGLSALLTTTMTEMGVVIEALKDNGLRDKVKVLIGGAAVSDDYAREIGADAYCLDGFQAIRVLDSLPGAQRN